MKLPTWELVTVLSLCLMVSGCGDNSSNMQCPEKGEDFFQKSVADYFQRHPPETGISSVQVLKGAKYDDHTKWWLVPVNVGDKKWVALLSCDGHLELSGR